MQRNEVLRSLVPAQSTSGRFCRRATRFVTCTAPHSYPDAPGQLQAKVCGIQDQLVELHVQDMGAPVSGRAALQPLFLRVSFITLNTTPLSQFKALQVDNK